MMAKRRRRSRGMETNLICKARTPKPLCRVDVYIVCSLMLSAFAGLQARETAA